MNKVCSAFVITLLGGVMGACSGSDPSANTNNDAVGAADAEATVVVDRSKDIVADIDFDFRIERHINLSVTHFPSEYGKINIYSGYAYFEQETGIYYPDYETRIASYIADENAQYRLSVTGENPYLVLEWLPMDGLSDEAYLLVSLDASDNYAVAF